jgi:hypothetical protein
MAFIADIRVLLSYTMNIMTCVVSVDKFLINLSKVDMGMDSDHAYIYAYSIFL